MQHNYKSFDIQSRLLWELFLESACRISAIQNLTLSQLDFKAGYFTGVREKGNKMVDVIYLDNTEKVLIEWLEKRKELKIRCRFFICNKGSWRV